MDLAGKFVSIKLIIFGSDRKKRRNSAVPQKKIMSEIHLLNAFKLD